ncbi:MULTISPECIES: hypothetical protein [Geobacillus]|uniref:YmiA family membrane protein n=1 Tax=Geobacillus thermodenitrificans TaxID=33940 RepID=A0ABY9QCL4_GEOTD|nr:MULTISPECIES: hypothetical protein [Geobacillus]MED3717080.1 hypothetical protein [Geobacillus thermodenitrificans]MED3905433.1 hypothetical protein [Geobacillus thermodenitrificans]MED4919290.1 hypothetical protein [Geobacillus thermodenitrificans]WMV75164.1 hypothetical protein HSX42_12895 [Geobacillus thermodenitrificans]
MTNRKQRTEDGERTSRTNWLLFFILLAASFIWGAVYWLWIAK